jgi:hypothetical protein
MDLSHNNPLMQLGAAGYLATAVMLAAGIMRFSVRVLRMDPERTHDSLVPFVPRYRQLSPGHQAHHLAALIVFLFPCVAMVLGLCWPGVWLLMASRRALPLFWKLMGNGLLLSNAAIDELIADGLKRMAEARTKKRS